MPVPLFVSPTLEAYAVLAIIGSAIDTLARGRLDDLLDLRQPSHITPKFATEPCKFFAEMLIDVGDDEIVKARNMFKNEALLGSWNS
ncbi:Beta-glucosidase [Novosphingobium sp. PY1]|jgi:hypothetical protein|uniref:Beta-glucosidase n=2 Tax=Alphaproteobacteria TaxID=28211 RepID=A0A292GT85_9HYPH|nr:beta-glucosidase [Ochrobactrum sp. PW1]GFM29390.1 Beta-glucosidase [Novosphingobium sp. PY1]